ncbi:MAG: hypothetical protein JRN15_13395 [Nitrososphaerota archaeon]|nr:hypothetical protein [Nitrososphaerota archaeon]
MSIAMLLASSQGLVDATIWLAVATFSLAVVASVQLVFTRKAVQLASDEATESIKSRIDQRAPIVVMALKALGGAVVSWRDEQPWGLIEHPTGEAIDTEISELGLCGWLSVRNDGNASALLSVPEGILVLPGEYLVTSINAIKFRRPQASQLSLAPGQENTLFITAQRSIEEWRRAVDDPSVPPLSVKFVAEDMFADGVLDEIGVDLVGIPVSFEDGSLVSVPIIAASINIAKSIRNYPGLS